MLASFEVELGADAPLLSVPWHGDEGALHFTDLRQRPESISSLPEAADPTLRSTLLALNADDSLLLTAKCDVWSEPVLSLEEQGFFPGARHKHACYIDVLWLDPRRRSDLADAEQQMRRWTSRLREVENDDASADLILRACEINGESGFYWSLYANGFGMDRAQAHSHWAHALAQITETVLARSFSPS